jgi:hypothetical protein
MNEEEEELITHAGNAGTCLRPKIFISLSLLLLTYFATERYFFLGLIVIFECSPDDGEHVELEWKNGHSACKQNDSIALLDTMYTQ